jgi:integrase
MGTYERWRQEYPEGKRDRFQRILRALRAHRAHVESAPKAVPEAVPEVVPKAVEDEMLGDMDLAQAAHFAVLSPGRFALVLVTGFRHGAEALRQQVALYTPYLSGTAAGIPKLLASHPHLRRWDRRLFFQLLDRVGPLETAPQECILEIGRSMGAGRELILKLVAALLRRAGRSTDVLDRALLRVAERTGQVSEWHRQRIEEVRSWALSCRNTAWPQAYAAKALHYFTRLLRDVPNLGERCATGSLEEWKDLIRTLCANTPVANHLVRVARAGHHGLSLCKWLLQFLNGPLHDHLGPLRKDLDRLRVRDLLRRVPNKRIAADPNARRSYTQQEVARLLAQKMDVAEAVILTLLVELALRNSAIRHLTYDTLIDPLTHLPRSVLSVLEKGNRLRPCAVSPNLARKIAALAEHWGLNTPPKCYVLNLCHPHQPLSETTLREKLARIARDADITDVHVHPHAFRHTLVERLIAEGNSIDLVSKYLGHTQSSVTSCYYYVPTPEQLGAALRNPFVPKSQPEPEVRLQAANAQLRACRQLLDIALHEPATLARLQRERPNFRDTLRLLDAPLDGPSDLPSPSPDPRNEDFY